MAAPPRPPLPDPPEPMHMRTARALAAANPAVFGKIRRLAVRRDLVAGGPTAWLLDDDETWAKAAASRPDRLAVAATIPAASTAGAARTQLRDAIAAVPAVRKRRRRAGAGARRDENRKRMRLARARPSADMLARTRRVLKPLLKAHIAAGGVDAVCAALQVGVEVDAADMTRSRNPDVLRRGMIVAACALAGVQNERPAGNVSQRSRLAKRRHFGAALDVLRLDASDEKVAPWTNDAALRAVAGALHVPRLFRGLMSNHAALRHWAGDGLLRVLRADALAFVKTRLGDVANDRHAKMSVEALAKRAARGDFAYVESFGAHPGDEDHLDQQHHSPFLLTPAMRRGLEPRPLGPLVDMLVQQHQSPFCTTTEQVEQRPVRAFLSLMHEGTQQTKAHHDNFSQVIAVLHGTGSKMFSVSAPRGEAQTFWAPPASSANKATCVVDVQMRRGDVLYLPAGYIHAVRTEGRCMTVNWGFPVAPTRPGTSTFLEPWDQFWRRVALRQLAASATLDNDGGGGEGSEDIA